MNESILRRLFGSKTRIVLCLLGATAALMLGAAAVKPPQQLDEFMAQKKTHSQAVLEGLMNDDFDAIILAGEKMKAMRADKRWDRISTEDYRRFSHNFQQHAQRLVDAGRRRDLDACMGAYVDCLQTCYNCHKYVRSYPYMKAFVDPLPGAPQSVGQNWAAAAMNE